VSGLTGEFGCFVFFQIESENICSLNNGSIVPVDELKSRISMYI
jgi:hypothetical protein